MIYSPHSIAVHFSVLFHASRKQIPQVVMKIMKYGIDTVLGSSSVVMMVDKVNDDDGSDDGDKDDEYVDDDGVMMMMMIE